MWWIHETLIVWVHLHHLWKGRIWTCGAAVSYESLRTLRVGVLECSACTRTGAQGHMWHKSCSEREVWATRTARLVLHILYSHIKFVASLIWFQTKLYSCIFYLPNELSLENGHWLTIYTKSKGTLVRSAGLLAHAQNYFFMRSWRKETTIKLTAPKEVTISKTKYQERTIRKFMNCVLI